MHWKEELDYLRSPETVRRSAKCDDVSERLLENGHSEYRKQNWRDALDMYNRALCFAEKDSPFEGLAYGNRAQCFFQLGMYKKAMIDCDFALKKNCPSQFVPSIEKARIDFAQLAEKQKGPKRRTPKVSLPVDKRLPCMANVLEIKRNKQFGRFVVAKRDIGVGQTVMVAEPFASATVTDKQSYCLSCQKYDVNLIPCPNCSDIMFCDEDCASWNNVHKIECGSAFHQLEDTGLKLIIQTVLIAVELFPNIEELMKFVEDTMRNGGADKIAKTSNDQLSQYTNFLCLSPSFYPMYVIRAFNAFSFIQLIPKLKYLFDTKRKQRFLMHLMLQHASVIPKNAFYDQNTHKHQLNIQHVFDILSMVNHSCVPNMRYNITDQMGYCVTVRPIKKGEQVFISYLGDDGFKALDQRQHKLRHIWGINCTCDKCVPTTRPADITAIQSNSSLAFLQANYEKLKHDIVKRLQLRKHCVKFLLKYGHLWSYELEYVIECFVSLL